MAGPAAAGQSRYAAELPGGSDKELNPDQPDVVFVKIIPIWLNPRRRHCSRCVAGPAGAVQSRYAAELPAGPDTKLQSRHAAELPAGSDTELNPDQPDLFFFVKIIPIWLNPRRRHCFRCVAGPAAAVQSRSDAELIAVLMPN